MTQTPEQIAAGSMFNVLWANVRKASDQECWVWTGKANVKGRGVVYHKGARMLAPRLAYWSATGQQPPADMFVCHTCDNPACCNPAHLWLGTPRDNVIDMHRKGRGPKNKSAGWQRNLTHCQRGHEFTPENTMPNSRPGRRKCRACNDDYQRRYREQLRAKRAILQQENTNAPR